MLIDRAESALLKTPWLAARDLPNRPSPTLRKLPTGGVSSATG